MLDIQIVGTDDTIKDAVDEAKANGKSLTLLLTVVPIVGFVGGVLCLLGGFLLLGAARRGRRSPRGRAEKDARPRSPLHRA